MSKSSANSIRLSCGVALCALFPTEGVALAQSAATVLNRTLRVGTKTNLGVQTLPNAQCFMHYPGESSSASAIKLFANDRGVVHFTVQPKVAGTLQLELDCTGDNGATRVVPVSLSSEAGASDINNDPAVTLPDVGLVQEALGPDPMSITPEQLRAAGYPRRPDPFKDPHLFASWTKMVTSRNARVVSELIPRPDQSFRMDENSSIWAGTGQRFGMFIETVGQWTVPGTWPVDIDTLPNASEVSFWVGVAGVNWPYPALAQSGVEQLSYCAWYWDWEFCNWPVWTTYPWIEYYPDAPSQIGITVNEGDTIYVDVWLSDNAMNPNCTGQWMTAYMYNFDTNIYALYMAPIPAGRSMPCGPTYQTGLFIAEGHPNSSHLAGWLPFNMYGATWAGGGYGRADYDDAANWYTMVDSQNLAVAGVQPDYPNYGLTFLRAN